MPERVRERESELKRVSKPARALPKRDTHTQSGQRERESNMAGSVFVLICRKRIGSLETH